MTDEDEDKDDFDYETFFKAVAELWRCLSSREMDYIYAAQDSLYIGGNWIEQNRSYT